MIVEAGVALARWRRVASGVRSGSWQQRRWVRVSDGVCSDVFDDETAGLKR